MGCGRQRCSVCREELIHRDHRKPWESASAVGQIVWRQGPVNITVADIDLGCLKILRNGSRLLRLIEQKQPGHSLRDPQQRLLSLLDECIGHCVTCPGAAHLRLDPRSGLILLRGHIAGSDTGRQKTLFDGEQTATHVRLRKTVTLTSTEHFYRLLDPEDRRRRNGGGWKR